MGKAKKIIITAVISVVAILLILTAVFACTYATRFKSIKSIKKITDYDEGINLYRMNVSYDYDLDKLINYGITDDQSFIDAVVKTALPLLPVHIKAPDFSCSAFSLTTEDGNVMMGRNYDFKNNTSAMLVYCEPEDGYKSVAFAALDNVNANAADKNIKSKLSCLTAPFICLDGMNEKGVSIAVLTLDSEPARQSTGKPAIATTLAIRLVLDRAATTEEAVELLKQYDMLATSNRDYHFYINDASGDGRVVEWDCHSDTRELVATKTRTVTNFFILYADKVTGYEKNGIYGHGKDRYEYIEDILDEEEGSYGIDTAWRALKKASQLPKANETTSNTQWSVVFNNSEKTLEFVFHRNWEDIVTYDLETNTVSYDRY